MVAKAPHTKISRVNFTCKLHVNSAINLRQNFTEKQSADDRLTPTQISRDKFHRKTATNFTIASSVSAEL